MNKYDKLPDTYRVLACNRCHRESGDKGVTLIKGKDSYYCIDCYMYLKNRGKQ